MGLGKRINRVIKSNVNSTIGFDKVEAATHAGVGAIGGGLTHAALGNMGLAFKGTAIGLYAPHMIVGGSMIGIMAYTVKKACE